MATRQLSERPWLLLPGTLCDGTVFDGFLNALGVPLCNRQQVELAQASVEDYSTIFDEVSDDTIVCGFSLGAIVAAHAADRMSPHCLILFGLNPFADDPAKAEGRHALAHDVKTVGGAAALKSRALDIFGETPDETRTRIFGMAEHTGSMIDAQTQLAITRPGALPALGNAKVPVYALTGSRDTSAPVAQGRAAADAAPMGRFHALDNLGHFALIEDPQSCADAIVQLDHDQRPAVNPASRDEANK